MLLLLWLKYSCSAYNDDNDDDNNNDNDYNAVANYIDGQFSCYDDDSYSKHKTTDYSNQSICFYIR